MREESCKCECLAVSHPLAAEDDCPGCARAESKPAVRLLRLLLLLLLLLLPTAECLLRRLRLLPVSRRLTRVAPASPSEVEVTRREAWACEAPREEEEDVPMGLPVVPMGLPVEGERGGERRSSAGSIRESTGRRMSMDL